MFKDRPCKVCNQIKCWNHCEGCGADIKWRPDNWERGQKYTGPKPLDINGWPHECSRAWLTNEDGEDKGTWRRIKASKIKCPLPICRFVMVYIEGGEDLTTQLQNHIKAHALKISQESADWIRATILTIRHNAKIPYIDPWFAVPASVIMVPEE